MLMVYVALYQYCLSSCTCLYNIDGVRVNFVSTNIDDVRARVSTNIDGVRARGLQH